MSTLTFSPAAQLRRPAIPAPARARTERPPRQPVRLTRRGRRAVAVLIVALMLGAFSGVAKPWDWVAAGAVSRGSQPIRIVTVAPGDTLWAVATRVAPGRDPRDTVAHIVKINGLRDSSVVAGQQIAVPVAG